MDKWHKPLVCYLAPIEDNGYRPKILNAGILGGVLLLALVLQAVYLFETRVATKSPDFLASVLPAVLVSLANEDRAENGLSALTINPQLVAAAQVKANDMAEKGYFAHVTPDGYEPWHFMQLAGYAYSAAGENLAVNFDDSSDVEKAWMNSPGHRANLLREHYTEVGIAVARGMYKGKEVTFVAQFFGRPALAAAPSASVTSVPTPTPTPTLPPTPTPTPSTTPATESVEVVVSQEIATATAPTESVTSTTPILETLESVAGAASVSLVDEFTASSAKIVTALLISLAVIVTGMFVVALVAHLRLPYVEALGGTLALLLVLIGLLSFNASTIAKVEVPSDSQAASVILAL